MVNKMAYPERDTPFLDCRKTPSGFSDKGLQSAARIICLPEADKFHTCSLRCIFCQVHAPAENDSDFFAAAAANSARLVDKL